MTMPALLAADPSYDTHLSSLRGRVVLVTGGSRDLGGAIGQVLGEAGARVVIADLAVQRAEDRVAILGERDIDAYAMQLDVADAAQCAEVIARLQSRFGKLDALINNAAIDVTAPIGELSVADWQRVIATNLNGPFLMAKHAAAVMGRQPGGGHIVNIASTASKRAWPHASAYHASKGHRPASPRDLMAVTR